MLKRIQIGCHIPSENMTNNFSKISVIIPAFNEGKTIERIIDQVNKAECFGLKKEIILVDDHSTDQTVQKINNLLKQIDSLKLLVHSENKGKGAALKTGFEKASGEIVIIQDADLEYNPQEYPKLIKPILDGCADVVYGSRFRSHNETRVLYFWHRVANGILTLFSNMFTNLNLTDMETGYKVFSKFSDNHS